MSLANTTMRPAEDYKLTKSLDPDKYRKYYEEAARYEIREEDLKAPVEYPPVTYTEDDVRIALAFYNLQVAILDMSVKFYFWKFIHNAIIHPLLAFPWDGPNWLNRLHDWTSERCPGAG